MSPPIIRYSKRKSLYEPPHDKTNKMIFAPSKDADQPGHPLSLIRVCCLHEETLGPQLPIEHTVKTLIRLGIRPGWSESAVGAQIILLVLSWGGSYRYDPKYSDRLIMLGKQCRPRSDHSWRSSLIRVYIRFATASASFRHITNPIVQILRPFFLFRWFKSSCQLLAKEYALSTGKLLRRLAQEQCG